MIPRVAVHEEVREALERNLPVVVLETAVLTHGLPREARPQAPAVFGTALAGSIEWDGSLPVNLATARALAATVRAAGGVPASSCVLDGVLRIGIEPDELQRLAMMEAEKCSARDLGRVMACGGSGGTTVAATLAACTAANQSLGFSETGGLKVFATGGIGGVHRHWNRHADISADIRALAVSSLVVVTAGAKVILDLTATREALDTNLIPVLGWQVGHFPRFTVQGRPGELAVPRVEDIQQVGSICQQHWGTLRRREAILLLNELPAGLALDGALVEAIVQEALAAADERRIEGPALTPFLLEYMAKRTGGAALEANIALLLNNVALATQVAGVLATNDAI
ncbi:MAG: hypothetical protein CBC35_03710 [Planctomycetes bacterium TMED75]|nr:pseudouridine-5-phosphate glycosidase [Planctomycetaceae bacterium]OUU94596.1 MAG: hypothetical protein CBC35_03710 [Planctomycetes bacterium TMED75]